MKNDITRRDALALGVSAAALAATGASAQTASAIKAAEIPAPSLPIEKGASLRMLRPVRFVKADEDVFRANAAKFTEKTGVEVKVDFVGWEDINQQTAVTANTGAGPDIIIGFSDAPHIYADKLVELSDVAEYLGKRYGGWLTLAQKYGKSTTPTTGSDCRSAPAAARWSTASRRCKRSASTRFRTITPESSICAASCKRPASPPASRSATRSATATASPTGSSGRTAAPCVDEDGKVAINSKETIEALKYLKELYPTFVAGHAILERHQQQPRLCGQRNLADGERRLAVFRAEERSGDGSDRRGHRASAAAEGPGEQLADGGTDAQRHGVQAQPSSQRRQGVPAVHAGDASSTIPGCRPTSATGRTRSRPMPERASGRAIRRSRSSSDAMRSKFWIGYKGPISQAPGAVNADYVMVQMCASVATGAGDTGGRGRRSRAPREALLPPS